MLYHNNGGKLWWVMFRMPGVKNKFIRKSTGTTDWAKARQIEQTMSLGLKGKLDRIAMENVLEAVYGVNREKVVGITFAEAIGEYDKVMRQRGKVRSERQDETIKRTFDYFVTWCEKRNLVRVCEVTSALALEYAESLRARGLSDKTRKNLLSMLSSVWRVLSGIEPAIGNPWINYIPAVKNSVRHGAFTIAEEAAILDAARKSAMPVWATLCLVARHTGLRKGDIARMKTNQVDLERGVIQLTPSKTSRYGIAVQIPMVKVLRDEISRWMSTRKNMKVADKWGEYLFPDFAREYPNDPVVTFKEILLAAGIRDETLTFHSYRHTFRTRLAESGAPDDLAKRLGGWTQDATLARYDHAEKTEEIRSMIERAAKRG